MKEIGKSIKEFTKKEKTVNKFLEIFGEKAIPTQKNNNKIVKDTTIKIVGKFIKGTTNVVDYSFAYQFSERIGIWTRDNIPFKGNINEHVKILEDVMNNYKKAGSSLWDGEITIRQPTKAAKFNKKSKIRNIKYVKILDYNMKCNKEEITVNCVYDILKKYEKRYGIIKSVKQIDKTKEWTVEEFYNFCNSKNIPLVIRDINLKIVMKIQGKKEDKKTTLETIVANNHLYDMSDCKIKTFIARDNAEKIGYCKDLNSFIRDSMCDRVVKLIDFDKKMNITRALIDNTLYLTDEKVYNIIKYFQDVYKIRPDIFNMGNTGIGATMRNILSEYKSNPFICNMIKPRNMLFANPDNKKKKNDKVFNIDFNKAYLSALCCDKIPFVKSNSIKPFSGVIEDDKLYYIDKVSGCTYGIMNDTGMVFGKRVKHLKNAGANFNIKNEFMCEWVDNPVKNIIKDVENDKQNMKLVRDEVIYFIGQGIGHIKPFSKVFGGNITTEDQFDGEIIDFGGFCAVKKEMISDKLYDCGFRVLSQYVCDIVIDEVMNKVYDLKKDDDSVKIMQIRTDGILFNCSKEIDASKYNNNKLGSWKIETKDKKKIKSNINNYDILAVIENVSNDINNINLDRNTYIDGYAGSGKTYKIKQMINDIKDKSYIVLSKTHAALKEYRKNKINCCVIEKLRHDKSIVKQYDYVFVDEHGLVNYADWEYIFINLVRANTIIISLGDHRQLLPIGEEDSFIDSDIFKIMFTQKVFNPSNFRNNFTKKFYDDLMNLDSSALNDVMERFYDKKEKRLIFGNKNTRVNVCSTHKTRIAVNKTYIDSFKNPKMVGDFVYPSDTPSDLIVQVLPGKNACMLHQYGLYSKSVFSFKRINGDNVELYGYDLEDETIDYDDIYTVPLENFNNGFFDYGYCFTLYSVQGASLRAFKVHEPERMYEGRAMYTLVSRLKEELLDDGDDDDSEDCIMIRFD